MRLGDRVYDVRLSTGRYARTRTHAQCSVVAGVAVLFQHRAWREIGASARVAVVGWDVHADAEVLAIIYKSTCTNSAVVTAGVLCGYGCIAGGGVPAVEVESERQESQVLAEFLALCRCSKKCGLVYLMRLECNISCCCCFQFLKIATDAVQVHTCSCSSSMSASKCREYSTRASSSLSISCTAMRVCVVLVLRLL